MWLLVDFSVDLGRPHQRPWAGRVAVKNGLGNRPAAYSHRNSRTPAATQTAAIAPR